jgi:KDO2-lipid IV(A) lauroyltransferase
VAALYMPQSNPTMDAWMKAGRNRFPNTLAISRYASPKNIIKTLREGNILYLLPDMDFGSADSVFVPFFATPASTLTSLGRFSQLGRAKVVTVFAVVTKSGYDVHLYAEWQNFPKGEAVEDARTMNKVLEQHIEKHPEQYYWLHKRFKTRPEGEASLYH